MADHDYGDQRDRNGGGIKPPPGGERTMGKHNEAGSKRLTWDAFVDHICETNEYYPDDPSELTDDDYEDLKEEYKWYLREH